MPIPYKATVYKTVPVAKTGRTPAPHFLHKTGRTPAPQFLHIDR